MKFSILSLYGAALAGTSVMASSIDLGTDLTSLFTVDSGIIHLGVDGILRSLDSESNVVDARQPNATQIQSLVKDIPASLIGSATELLDSLLDTVGDIVPVDDEQVWNPGKGILPSGLLGGGPRKGHNQTRHITRDETNICPSSCQAHSECDLHSPCGYCFTLNAQTRYCSNLKGTEH